MIKTWWQSYEVNGTPDSILVTKLKLLKKDLTIWNREEFGKIAIRRRRALEELSLLQQNSEGRALSQEEKSNSLRLQMEIQQLAKEEEVSWRQKSRCLWLKEGDRNTKFFQKVANSNRRSNCIDTLRVEEEIIEDKALIRAEILDFYQKLYTENESWRPSIRLEDVATLTGEEKEGLERPFEEEEVLAIIKACAPDKAPGPDGYSMAFFEKAWAVIKNDIALQHFHQNGNLVRSCNASFIALIPKKKGATELRDYRPINLIGSVYKFASKILAERLKRVIGKFVSGHQNAFIKTRQIPNATLLASETLDWKMKSGQPGLLFKLDIEKALDQLNWAYLINILRQMGFGKCWIRWIKFCITTVKYSILMNGGPVGFFSPQKGPLSPFLFILAMEGLSKMLHKANRLHWMEGFKVGNVDGNCVTVSDLLYADDTLIFCGADKAQVLYVNVTLMIFEAISGLHMNMLKSTIYPINLVPNLEELAKVMCCKVGSFPTSYLGLPPGARYKSLNIWDGVIEKFEKKLTSWKMQYLSFGGRLTLINSV